MILPTQSDTGSPFRGIYERLKRTDQNIHNLDVEIAGFIDGGEYKIMPYGDAELVLKAAAYHRDRPIPLRFSVLAGEIIHHLRSCLDHLAWRLSTGASRTIEFPIFKRRPVQEKELARYKGKISGIINPDALRIIEGLQPYNFPNPYAVPLAIVHDMDIMDKHKELLLCVSSATAQIVATASPDVERYFRNKRYVGNDIFADLASELKKHAQVIPQVSFGQFGGRKSEPIIPALVYLAKSVRDAILLFADVEFPK